MNKEIDTLVSQWKMRDFLCTPPFNMGVVEKNRKNYKIIYDVRTLENLNKTTFRKIVVDILLFLLLP